IALAIQGVMLAGFIGFYALRGEKVSPNASLLILPWLVLLLAGFSLGFGILISAVTTRYRDLVHVIGFGAQLWMYATPVIYPLSTIPDKYRWVALLNPLSPVFEVARHALLGVGSLRLGDLLYSSLAMVAVLAVGMVLFNRVERNFMDTV
ncbi:MAG: ABC transporter permease, partial [Verrucomicrobiota bacterium]